MPRRTALAFLALAALACQTITGGPAVPTPAAPPAQPSPGALPTAEADMLYAEATYLGPLTLQTAHLPLGNCDQPSPFNLPPEGLEQVAFLPTGVCFNGEIGLLEIGDSLYVVQSGGYLAAFMLTDVTNPARPQFLGAWEWKENTYSSDVKPFRQGDRWYLALGMEGFAGSGGPTAPCGVAIVEVTDPRRPSLVGNYYGRVAGSPAPWCNVHTTQIAADEAGNGTHILASSDDTADLRVLDVRDLPQVREAGRYRLPDIHLLPDGSPEEFVHDTTVTAGRVYVSYWGAGLIVLDRAELLSGGEARPLNEPRSIDPAGFYIHHSFPTLGEEFVFLEDEITYRPGEFSQLRLWDIRDLSAPREAMQLALREPLSPPHNLLVDGDLLYVGWYADGVRIFRYDLSDADSPSVEPAYNQPVRAERGASAFGENAIFDGIYGVRLHPCTLAEREATCVYASDLTLGLLILALPPVEP